MKVLSLDYRLAPEYPYPAALEDTLAVVDALTTGPDGARPLVLAGDSAGANLALSAGLALARRAGAGTSPAARLVGLILLSPHLAHRPQHPSHPDELGALPPTLIQVGTADSAFLDAVGFARAARAAGCQTTLDVWDGLSHAWQHHRDRPEAEAALLEAARFAVTLGH